ncbi:hypothetical protein G7Y89_g11895 [Cudoniella acicularis]|uniref:Metallo-beta-lactamase domain-containing protein n=1 Tax=Cudoniella acicularis TaxID=354080 RepID=A0A8H4VXG4_9HELO|nr:hypothetical protein G7Y89_g11895 [Cudoniella acicularis]
MADPYEDWDVRSYFLNVGIGDSSVHILINRVTNHLESGVLIDGGVKGAVDAVSTAITAIPEFVNDPAFRLTAVVVTHFDEDHVGGLLKLLYDDWVGRNPRLSIYTTLQTVFYCPMVASKSKIDNGRKIRLEEMQNPLAYNLQFRGPLQNDQWVTICRAMPSTYALGYDMFSNTHHRTGTFYTGPPQNWPVTFNDVYAHCNYLTGKTRPIFLVYGIDSCNLDPVNNGHNS